MTWKTHIIGGVQSGVILAGAYGGKPAESSLLIGAAVLGSLLPDIDHEKGKLAQSDAIAGLAAKTVCRFTKHRGFTHTVPGAALFAAATYGLMMFNSVQQALMPWSTEDI